MSYYLIQYSIPCFVMRVSDPVKWQGRYFWKLPVHLITALPAKHMVGPNLCPNAVQLPVVSCTVVRG